MWIRKRERGSNTMGMSHHSHSTPVAARPRSLTAWLCSIFQRKCLKDGPHRIPRDYCRSPWQGVFMLITRSVIISNVGISLCPTSITRAFSAHSPFFVSRVRSFRISESMMHWGTMLLKLMALDETLGEVQRHQWCATWNATCLGWIVPLNWLVYMNINT